MKPIKKAVFPVAGMGTRFLPATKASPKEMLPIVDKPLIQYAVEEAVEAGCTEMVFITGRNKRSIEDHFDKAYELETELEMRQKNPSEFIAADVALVENGSSSEKMYINKGSAQGIKINLPVMFNGYLIGKISKVSDEYSEVTLLTSKTSKLSVVLNGTDQQILRGNGNGTFSILNYNEGKVDKNTVFNVETSGVSDILPRGIKIGTLKVTNLNDFMYERCMDIVKGVSEIYGVESKVVMTGGTSGANSDKEVTEIFYEAAKQSPFIDDDKIVKELDFGACEDFAHFMRALQDRGAKSGYMMIGTNLKAGHHNSKFDFDEECLVAGVDIYLRAAYKLNGAKK